jgi:hypothetical protein
MINEHINLYTNISGKTQTVYADWSNPTDVADDGTINLYESIGDNLVAIGLFTLTTEDTETAVSERSMDEVDASLDVLESIVTADGIGESLINFGTNSIQVGGKDILYDGTDGHVYKILLTNGTLSVYTVS